MRYSTLLSASLFLCGVLAVYPPPANIDTSDPDLVTIQGATGSIDSKDPGYLSNGAIQNTDTKDLIGASAGKVSNTLDNTTNEKKSSTSSETLNPFYSFYLAISMIVVSEIGDKTFLIAAIMAMRHPHMVVFSAASSALILMTVLSGAIGQLLPHLLSPTLTRATASILFLFFGINLLREGLNTDKNQGVEEELAEVEEEIASAEIIDLSANLENGQVKSNAIDWKNKLKDLISYVSSPVWFQTFSMTFLGEWGDRSQITTIAMAAGGDWIMIVLGGCIGHAACTLLAVLAGHAISTKISMRTILLGGSFAFFIFSLLYGYSAIYE